MIEHALSGVFAAVLTPIGPDLEPDLPAFVGHCRWLLANGCDGLAPLGTTGEANSFSTAQKLRVMEALALSGLPTGRMIVGTGTPSVAETASLTRAARAMGFGGVLVLPPFYYKSPSEEGLYAWYAAVIDRVADPTLRLYLYHFPQMSAVPLPLTLIARLKDAYADIIAGLKDSGGDWAYSAAVLEQTPGFGLFSGTERFLSEAIGAGGAGCISATVNATAPLAAKVMAAIRSGDAAACATAQADLSDARLALQGFPLIAGLKEIKATITGDAGWRRSLPPQIPLSPADAERLMAEVRARTALWRALQH